MNICRKCGAVIRDGDKYCSKCGARSPSVKALERKEKAQKKKREKKITFQTRPENSRGYRENFEEGENRSHALLVTVSILVVMMLAVAAFAMFYLSKKKPGSGRKDYSSDIRIISETDVETAKAPEDAASKMQTAPESASGRDSSGEAADPGTQAVEESEASEAQDPKEGEASETQDAKESEASGAQDVKESEASGAQDVKESETPETDVQEENETSETQAVKESEPQEEDGAAPETESEAASGTGPETPSAAEAVDPAQIQAILESGSTAASAEVYIYDLKNDSEAALNDCTQPMYASALITVPILYTAASRIDSGEMTMDDPIPYVTSIGGRGEMTTEQRDGLEFPLSFYLQTMVNYSDNNCINVLIDYIGLDTINAVCREAGYTSVNLERGLVAGDPGGLDNYVSAKDITMMVKDLYTGAFSSVGEDYMRTYFHISEGDSLPTLIGLAPGLQDASAVLNQNGHGMTRYNETALIEDNGALYILTIMLHGDSGMVYSPGVTDVAEYVSSVMAG